VRCDEDRAAQLIKLLETKYRLRPNNIRGRMHRVAKKVRRYVRFISSCGFPEHGKKILGILASVRPPVPLKPLEAALYNLAREAERTECLRGHYGQFVNHEVISSQRPRQDAYRRVGISWAT
jgi:hypothetical protein